MTGDKLYSRKKTVIDVESCSKNTVSLWLHAKAYQVGLTLFVRDKIIYHTERGCSFIIGSSRLYHALDKSGKARDPGVKTNL